MRGSRCRWCLICRRGARSGWRLMNGWWESCGRSIRFRRRWRGRGWIHVLAERQVDLTLAGLYPSGGDGDVALGDEPLLELAAQPAVGVGVEGHDDDAGCIAIQTVHDAGPWIRGLDAAGEAILVAGADPRHRQQPRGLAEHDQVVVSVEQIEVGHGLDGAGHAENHRRRRRTYTGRFRRGPCS